ncbi:MAG: class I SAM-dependent methyltransferase [Opitutaceae bacterium]
MNPPVRPAVALLVPVFLLLILSPAARAQLGARSTAEWLRMLDAQTRVSKLRVDDVVAALALPPGAKVADIGAGSGVFTLPLAGAVTSSGRVYAVDIDQGLVDHITGKAREAKATQVQGVLGKFTDPSLPARDVDLAFIYDVLHHIEDRATYLRNLAGYLQPGGRIAVIDFFPERGPHRNDPALQITKEQTRRLMAEAGLRLLAEHRLYDDKWFVIYAK